MSDTGRIVHVDEFGAFGFIDPETGGPDVFFRFAWVDSGTPQVGARVSYQVKQGHKGPQARAVEIGGP